MRFSFTTEILRYFPPPHFLRMPAVGIDISDSSIKYLEAVPRGSAYTLRRFGEADVPAGVVQSGEIKDEKRLSEILQKLRRDQKLSYVRVSLPEEKAYFFHTQVPDLPDKEMRSVIEFKLEEHVPIAPAEAVFDYEIIESRSRDHFDVGVAVFPKAAIARYSRVIKNAGLVPLGFTVEAQAIADAVIRPRDANTYMLIDFGKFRTGLAIASHRVLQFTSTLEVSGEDMTKYVMEGMHINREEAERFKNEEGIAGSASADVAAKLMSVVEKLKGEIERHYAYWRTRPSETETQEVSRVILVGGNANLAGLPEYLSSSLGIPVAVGDVWTNLSSAAGAVPEITKERSLGYATAVGLALGERAN